MAAQPRPGGTARLRSFRPVIIAIALLACVAGTQAWVDAYRPAVNDEAGMAFSGAAVVVRSVAGQLRGLLADFLWLRVDEYAHRRRLVDGDLNRADDAALMPLVRLIAWLNPHYVDAYALGGQWLAFHFGRARDAVTFYDEGIRNNPQAADLLTGVAFVHWRLLHDNKAAAARVEQAANLTGDDQARFQALWLEAHILLDGGDRAGAIRVWHRVAAIPGYGQTARHFLALLARGGAVPAAPAAAPGIPRP
jgi:hypothetical protein